MFFRLMLWVLAKRITSLVENNPAFREALGNRVCVLQFTSANHRVARYYAFTAGKIRSESALHERPSLTFRFASTGVARNLIFSMARKPGDQSIMVDAINQAKLRLEGDMSLLTWFMGISGFFAPQEKNA